MSRRSVNKVMRNGYSFPHDIPATLFLKIKTARAKRPAARAAVQFGHLKARERMRVTDWEKTAYRRCLEIQFG